MSSFPSSSARYDAMRYRTSLGAEDYGEEAADEYEREHGHVG